jgi:Tfp pilus assembly protein PilX
MKLAAQRVVMNVIHSGRRRSRQRGSALVIMIILSVVITGMVMCLAWSSGIEAQSVGNRAHTDDAVNAAEGALQWAIYELRQSPTWRPTTVKPVVNGWTCTVSYTDMGSPAGAVGNPLKITVVAKKATTAASATVSAKVAGVLAYTPLFYSSGSMVISESATLLGDMQTQGALAINGPGSLALGRASGILKAVGAFADNTPANDSAYFGSVNRPAGNATGLTTPTQTVQQIYNNLTTATAGNPSPTVDFSQIEDWSTGNLILDFTKANGKPVLLHGFAPYTYGANVGIRGSGTLIIADGDVTFSGGFPFNASSANLNLVCMGNANFSSGPLTFNGSFYVKNNWNQTGSYNISGTILVNGTSSIGGTGTVNVASPPAYDPRYVPRITGYYGNLP